MDTTAAVVRNSAQVTDHAAVLLFLRYGLSMLAAPDVGLTVSSAAVLLCC